MLHFTCKESAGNHFFSVRAAWKCNSPFSLDEDTHLNKKTNSYNNFIAFLIPFSLKWPTSKDWLDATRSQHKSYPGVGSKNIS